jgi:hypothetical protein
VQREIKVKDSDTEIELDIEADNDEYLKKFDDQEKKKRKGYKCKSDMEMRLRTTGDDGAKVSIDLKAENGDAKARFKFSLKVDSIIEFEDAGTAGYDNETILSTFELGKGYKQADGKSAKKGDVGFEDWASAKGKVKDSTGRKEFSIATVGDTFRVVGHYCGKAVAFKRTSGELFTNKHNLTYNLTIDYKLNPNAAKFDFILNKYQYKSNTSKLAILAKLKTKSKFKVHKIGTVLNEKNKEELDIGSGSGGFSWSKKVFADGVEKDVLITDGQGCNDKNDECERWYYFTFDHKGKVKNFLWDPEIVGDMGGQEVTSGAGQLAPLFSVFTGLVSVFFYFLN